LSGIEYFVLFDNINAHESICVVPYIVVRF